MRKRYGKRPNIIATRLDDLELQKVKHAMKAAKMTSSQFLREAVLRRAKHVADWGRAR